MHWIRGRNEGWQWKAALNGLGALATVVVSIVQIVTKFSTGAWIVVVIIPLIIVVLKKIHSHYDRFAREVEYTGHAPLMFFHHAVVVPTNGITKPTAGALVYATTISSDVRAVYIEVDSVPTQRLLAQWSEWDIGVDLTVVPSPYRSVLRPLVDYVSGITERGEADLVTVVVPEIVPHRWWEYLLHNKTALFIRTAFLFKPNVVVTVIPYRLGKAARLSDLVAFDELAEEESKQSAGTFVAEAAGAPAR